jgi:hypothetical protein
LCTEVIGKEDIGGRIILKWILKKFVVINLWFNNVRVGEKGRSVTNYSYISLVSGMGNGKYPAFFP